MNPCLIGAGTSIIAPATNPLIPGMQVGARMSGAGSTGHVFSPASNGFQLGDGFRSPAQREIHAAAGEAHDSMLLQVQQCMTSPQENDNARTGGLRLIDSAQSKALDAVFQQADDPAQAEQVYAAGRYAARIGVEDLAVALSELRLQGGAPQDCERMEKALCKMIVKDGLGDHSGFSAWHDGNCYGKVKALTVEITTKLDALPGKPDIFKGVMQREVMPAIRQYVEARYGTQSYATWQKIDAAGGLISHAAAEAAGRMTDTMRAVEQEGGAGGLRAKVNQWRVAQHWAEMMRGAVAVPEQTSRPSPAVSPEHPTPVGPSAATARAAAPAPYSVTQTANPVFKPIIIIGGHKVDETLTRILEEDDVATMADPGSDGDAVQTAQVAVAQRVEAEPADVLTERRDEHGADVPPSARREPVDDVDGQVTENSNVDPLPQTSPADLQHADQSVTELDGGLRNLNEEPPLPSPAPTLRNDTVSSPPPPPPQPPRSTTSTRLRTTATSPSAGATTSVSPANDQGGNGRVTMRGNRAMTPIQELIQGFENAGIGMQRPIGNVTYAGSLLRNVGNRISTTEWPLLRSVSDGDGSVSSMKGSGGPFSRPASPDAEEPVSLRNAQSSPSLPAAHADSSSEAGRIATSPYHRLSTAGRTVQIGPGFEPFNGSRQ